MKLHQQILEADDDGDDEPYMAKLKNLSKHVFHGRAFLTARDADAALAVVDDGGEGDVLIWHDWNSDTVYEISIASTTRSGITRNLDAIRKAVPRSNLSIAHKSGMVDHHDWSEYHK